jgi:putative hydrolase of the HAD superfamily
VPKAVLLDLGGVVLGISVAKVFQTWADRAGVDVDHFERKWVMDEAYELHETGHIDFTEYARRLSLRFAVDMPLEDWQTGWNSIWTEPYAQVVKLLPAIAEQYDLYAFSNTNAVHAASFFDQYPTALAAFNTLFLSHEIGLRKPYPQAFAQVCKEIDTQPNDVLFIDDNSENIAGALSIGLDAHHLREESSIAEKLQTLLN